MILFCSNMLLYFNGSDCGCKRKLGLCSNLCLLYHILSGGYSRANHIGCKLSVYDKLCAASVLCGLSLIGICFLLVGLLRS